jgi:hypothetical protein
MFPAKIFEYTAAAKPVLSTVDFGGVCSQIPSFTICVNSTEFTTKLRELQSESRLDASDALECEMIASRNTWSKRAQEFVHFAGKSRHEKAK